MKVFVFEHLSGGLGPEEAARQPEHLLAQGGAMLRAAAEDFLALGSEVLTVLHGGARVDRSGLTVTPLEAATDAGATFDRLAGEADVALVIAPESGGALVEWLERLAEVGTASLGCSPEAAHLCGDKAAIGRHLEIVNVPTPQVRILADAPAAEPWPYPVVAKPRCGAGCEKTFVCQGAADLAALDQAEDWIVQRFVPGKAVSCSLIVHGTRIISLLPGEQFIAGDRHLSYTGGRIPLAADLAQRATRLAEDAAAWVPGLHGFVGVDLVLGETPEDDRVIELNPRLTLSYVALRRLCTTNLAEALLDAEAPVEWSDGALRFDAAGACVGD